MVFRVFLYYFLKKGLLIKEDVMTDPFSALSKSLQTVFHLESMRNGKYIYPAIQQLDEVVQQYDPGEKNSFINLLQAIHESLPHIEKWRVDFDVLKKSMDALAKIHQMPPIDWIKILSHPGISSRFKFSALHRFSEEEPLSSWLKTRHGTSFFQMNPHEMTQALLANQDRNGFSPIFQTHLEQYPNFLFQLIMDSDKNFTEICSTRLILYLTDQQIAKAIIQHIPKLVHKKGDPYTQVEQLINTLNDMLSNGCSVSNLLRNAHAKPILLNSTFFQIYQSEGYEHYLENQQQRANILEDESPKLNG